MSKTQSTNPSREAAEQLLAHGIMPIPVKPGSKQPATSGWQKLRPTKDDLDDLFPSDQHTNIGVLLGEPSGGLVDLDCDSPEAIAAARAVLHEASVTSGRGEDEASHYWFRVTDGAPKRTQRFEDPVKPGAVIVELRSTGGQTVVPPSMHPDGTPYRWVKPITEDGTVDDIERAEMERIARTVASIALLARYWPQKGSRHLAHLALCGALLRHPDTGEVNEEWRTQAHGFAKVVAGIGGDLDYYTRDENIDTTIASIERGDPVQGWTTLTQYVPKAAVWQVREWLDLVPSDPEEAEPEEEDWEWEEDPESLDDEWNRVMLGEAIEQGIPDPEELLPGTGVLYAGEVMTLQSSGGSGKTLIALNLMWRLIKEGRKVVFIDEENGPFEVARRLLTFGAGDERGRQLLDENLIYYAMPSVDWMDRASPDRLVSLCDEHDVSLVVFDSVMDMMAASGLDENSNSEFNDMYARTIKRLKNEGRAVLLLDHVSKDSQWQGRGASAKFDQASIVWGVKVEKKFDGNTSGVVTLKRRKGRLAAVVEEITVFIDVNPAEQRTDIRFVTGSLFAAKSTHDKVVAALIEAGATSEDSAVTKTEVYGMVEARRADVIDTLNEADPPLQVKQLNGRTTVVWAMQ